MAVNFSEELTKYNERLIEELETDKNEAEAVDFERVDENYTNEIPDITTDKSPAEIDTASYQEKIGSDNLQTHVDSQSLTAEERVVVSDDNEPVKVQNPKDGNEKTITIVGDDATKDETDTYHKKVETYREKLSVENLETDAEETDEAEPPETVNVTNPKDNPSHLVSTPDPITQGRSLDTQGAEGDNHNAIYQPIGSEWNNVGQIIARSTGFQGGGENTYERIEDNSLPVGGSSWSAEAALDVFDPSSKIENSLTSNDFKFFLYNNVPYVIGEVADLISGVVNSVESVINAPENLFQQWGTVRLALDTMHELSYYTADEGLQRLAGTFATLQLLPFTKGISVKTRRMSIDGGLAQKFSDTYSDADINLDGVQMPEVAQGEGSGNLQNWFDKAYEWIMNAIRSIMQGEPNSDVPDQIAYFSAVNEKLTEVKTGMVTLVKEQLESVINGTHYKQKGDIPQEQNGRASSAFTMDDLIPLSGENPKDALNDSDRIERVMNNSSPEYDDYFNKLENSLTYRENGEPNISEELRKRLSEGKNHFNLFMNRIAEKEAASITNERNIVQLIRALDTNTYAENLGAAPFGTAGSGESIYGTEEREDEIKGDSKNSLDRFIADIEAAGNQTNIYNIIRSGDEESLKAVLDDMYEDGDNLERIKDSISNSMSELRERMEPVSTHDAFPTIHGLLRELSPDTFASAMNDSQMLEKSGETSSTTKKNIWTDTINARVSTSIRLLQGKEEVIANFKGINSIGYIIVYPTITDGGAVNAFKIPFQFNPLLTESGAAARYESQQLLHRQGNLYSYVGNDGQTLSIETEYLMTTDGNDGSRTRNTTLELGHEADWNDYEGPQSAWYDNWTPRAIQAIEKALRSITLPQVSGDGNTDIKFHRPPMVKIVFGRTPGDGWNTDTIHPMLTYPITSGETTKFYHRTYLVTSINIQKDLMETPLLLDDRGNLMDTHGFKVTMELNEVDSNYIGILPNLGDYYNSFRNNITNTFVGPTTAEVG